MTGEKKFCIKKKKLTMNSELEKINPSIKEILTFKSKFSIEFKQWNQEEGN